MAALKVKHFFHFVDLLFLTQHHDIRTFWQFLELTIKVLKANKTASHATVGRAGDEWHSDPIIVRFHTKEQHASSSAQ